MILFRCHFVEKNGAFIEKVSVQPYFKCIFVQTFLQKVHLLLCIFDKLGMPGA